VILALAILAGSLAILGELVRLGLTSAADARDLTTAQMLCESVLAEMVSGAAPVEPVAGAPLPDTPDWLYTVEIEPTLGLEENLVAMRVTVSRDPAVSPRGVSFSLVRWIKDPNAAITTTEQTDQASQPSGSQSSSSTSGSSSPSGTTGP
jgi:hypothetical protein